MIMSTYNYLCAPNYRLSDNIRGSPPTRPFHPPEPLSFFPFSAPFFAPPPPLETSFVKLRIGDRAQAFRFPIQSPSPFSPFLPFSLDTCPRNTLLCSDVCLFMCYRFDERHYAFERYAPQHLVIEDACRICCSLSFAKFLFSFRFLFRILLLLVCFAFFFFFVFLLEI